MLREVATLIKGQVRDSDFVGRLGGDEFGALLIGCPINKARQIAADICNAVADYRFVWKDKIFNIGVSIGILEISHISGTVQDVMSAADSACYVAKQEGKGKVHIYSARDEAVARDRGDIRWLRELQTALHDGSFELAVQPIISMSRGADSGPAVEVLIRLPGRRSESETAEFLRPAQRYQLMPQIDRWVVNATLTAISGGELKIAGHRSCAINLSGQTIADDSFLGFVVDALDRTEVRPSKICFEVTERAILDNVKQAQRFIEVLHGIGCDFSLDDFGTGMGSCSRRQVYARPADRRGQPGDGGGDDKARAYPGISCCRRAGRATGGFRLVARRRRRLRTGLFSGPARSPGLDDDGRVSRLNQAGVLPRQRHKKAARREPGGLLYLLPPAVRRSAERSAMQRY
jgi:predicted signal transduction protein with EAL and GGDEF domain